MENEAQDIELTEAQATDTAHYFLGSHWKALHTPGAWILLNAYTREQHVAENVDAVFRFAGVRLPLRRRYAAVGYTIKSYGAVVAHARSTTMAQRIANALEAYTPNAKGY